MFTYQRFLPHVGLMEHSKKVINFASKSSGTKIGIAVANIYFTCYALRTIN